jgi:citrate synthase
VPVDFDPELAAVAATQTTLSDLDADGELVVGGYPIEELAANATYEEALYLLFEGRLPTDEELEAFRSALAANRDIDDTVRSLCATAAETGAGPMDALELGLAPLTLDTGGLEPAETARRVVAAAPTIVATYWRHRQGEEPVDPDPSLGHAADFLRMLTGASPGEDAVRGLETFLVTVLEHGLNTPTFAARTVVSTDSPLVSAATTAVGALGGERHSGSFAALADVLERVHESGNAESVVRERLAADERVPGFGHPVYRARDPRAAVLSAAAERYAGEAAFLATVERFESTATALLDRDRPESTARPTLELHIVPLLSGVGVPAALFGATFAVARLGGVMAHCLEQLETDRLIRPSARYVGASDNEWLPVDQRATVGDVLLRQPDGASSLEAISETLATLSEPSRLEILLALYDTDGPLAYSTLREATTIDDKGRFNYHLRQLREYFVTDDAEGYALTDAGRRVVDTVVTDDGIVGDDE